MKIGLAIFARPNHNPGPEPGLGWLSAFGRKIEDARFDAIWVGDSFGRGEATLDPFVALSALHASTNRVELGVGVLQVPLRPVAELAHRIQSLNALLAGRFRLGVGAGSTKADFDLVGADYESRFRTLETSLEAMRRLWAGETVNGGRLSIWPGTLGGPPVYLGTWRSARWIEYAARCLDGWVASGLHSSWEDVEHGMRLFRQAGGKHAILTSIPVNLSGPPDSSGVAAKISLVCPAPQARERLNRLRDIGIDEVLLIADPALSGQLPEIRALAE